MAQETVVVPDIGGSEAAEVVEVLVAVGDQVDVEQGLIVLESDKASMEIPSTVAGVVSEVLAKEGDELGEGAAVAIIEVAGDASGAATGGDDTSGSGGSPENSAQESNSTAAPDPAAVAASSPADMASEAQADVPLDVEVPDIGTDDAVDLVEISVSVGDRLDEGDTIVVLESDKASMEVPAPAPGTVTAIHVEDGQQVKQGDLLIAMSAAGAQAPPKPSSVDSDAPVAPVATAAQAPAAAEPASNRAAAPSQSPKAATGNAKDVYAGPAVRKLAREFGVPLDKVSGSGPRGRLLKEDLHSYVQKALDKSGPSTGAGIPIVPDVDFSKFGPVEVVERSKIDKLTAANMQRNWLNVPHVTQFDDADITELEVFRKSLKGEAEKRGTKITPMSFLVKACAVALKRHDKINSSLSDGGESLTFKHYVHIGMAVDTPAGLVVPVIRDADKKSIWDIGDEILDLAGRARDRKLKPAEMQGACFTISSLGAIGGRGFTPIVNAPEVAILGVGRASVQPVWNGSEFLPRQMMPLGLSYDHRVINGGDAGRFLTELCELLGDIRKQLL